MIMALAPVRVFNPWITNRSGMFRLPFWNLLVRSEQPCMLKGCSSARLSFKDIEWLSGFCAGMINRAEVRF